MSAFSGPQKKYAMRDLRMLKRLEAEERNAKTPLNRRKQWRRSSVDGTVVKKTRRGGRRNKKNGAGS